jgi:hypothetical protein
VVLDMDSTEIPVYGQQENSAYNGHFESTCYHPLLLFNGEGDCLAAKLRSGNVHSAEDWAELLLPEIERQQKLGKEVVFRADAAFAKPEIYEALEERGVKYAIRIPANDSLERDIGVADAASGKTKPQAGGVVQGLPLPSRELEDGAACGGERRVPLRGVVPPSRIHRDQLRDTQPERGAFLQQARDGRAVDQRGKASGEDDATELSSFPLKPGTAGAESAGLQLGEFVAAAGVAQAHRELVADEFTAKTGEDGRTVKHARYYWLLLAESHLTRRLFGSMVRRIAVLSLPAG